MLDQIRSWAMSLPGVEEGAPVRAARRVAAFKVDGKSFLGVEAGEETITISLPEPKAEHLLSTRQPAYEAIRRNGTLLGLRVVLSRVSADELRDLIEQSWRHINSTRGTRGPAGGEEGA